MMWVVHIFCLLFFIPGLVFSIPIHILINIAKSFSSKGE